MDYGDLKIFKICSYESDKIKSLIEKLPIYSDKSKLILFDNFIGELYGDFCAIISKHKFIDYIEYLLKEKNKPEILSFTELFKIGSILPDFNILDFIKIKDDNIFNNIIDKYSCVYINNKDIPLDPLTNLRLSNEEFNISLLIFEYILNTFNNYTKNIYIISQSRLEKIISYLPKSNNYFTSIIYALNCKSYCRQKNLSEYIKKNITHKISIDIEKIKKEEKENFLQLYLHILFKLLVEYNKFKDFDKVLNMLYCCSYLDLLEMINIIKSELIKLNLIVFKKIIYYGRLKVFEFLFFNIQYIILDLLSESNPLDISEYDDICYTDDIWHGKIWFDREYEKKIIGFRNHKNLINLIFSICAEKKYSHVLFTEDIKRNWISLALQYKLEKNYQDSNYFITYDDLLDLFELKFDITNTDSIQLHIKMFGKKATWDWIKETNDENFLDLFF